MQLGADHVVVRVPATSANLGPGFDSLGLALGLYDTIDVRLMASDEVRVEVHGEGAGQVPTDENHLVVRALRHTLDLAGVPQTGIRMICTNNNPHGRGLGSSASAIVSGIVAARALLADPRGMDDRAVLSIATEFEGHPDNAAPAIMGGATVAWTSHDGPRAATLEVDASVVVTALIPDEFLATDKARAILPASVPISDAIFNASRAALLVEALARRPELLFDATEDRLHQGYRADIMPASTEIMGALRAEGFAAVISGAGPTVLVLTDAAKVRALDGLVTDLIDGLPGWRAIRPTIDTRGAVARRAPEVG